MRIADLKRKGDVTELMVAADLARRGHRILFPYGEDCDCVRATKHYTSTTVDWPAVYDDTTDRCYYVPASELGDGRALLHLRLAAARNNQRARVRLATDYLSF